MHETGECGAGELRRKAKGDAHVLEVALADRLGVIREQIPHGQNLCRFMPPIASIMVRRPGIVVSIVDTAAYRLV
jgi:hypothetical protein